MSEEFDRLKDRMFESNNRLVTPVGEGKRMGISEIDAYRNAITDYLSASNDDDAQTKWQTVRAARRTLESQLRAATLDSARLGELERLMWDGLLAVRQKRQLDGQEAVAYVGEDGWMSFDTLTEAADASLLAELERRRVASLTPPSVSPVSSGEAKE